MIKLPAIIAIISLIILTVEAQEISTMKGVIPLDTIVVAANPDYSSASITEISPETIANQDISVAYDALESAPGLHIVQRLALTGAGLSRLTIRGAGSSGPTGLQLFIDGRPDPTFTFVHPAPQAHNANNIASLQVIRGPSPVLFGSGNTGVVNIANKAVPKGWSGNLLASGGSFSTTENFGALSYGGEKGYISADFTYRRTEGYLPDDTDAWIATGNIRAGLQLAKHWRLRFSAGQSADHFAVFGPFSVPGPFGNPGTTDLDLTQTVVDLTVDGNIGGLYTSLKLWGDNLEPRSQVVPDGAERADVNERGVRLKGIASPWPKGKLIVGLDYLQGKARNTPALPPTAPEVDVEVSEVGPYIFLEQQASSYLTLNGGIRLVSHSEYESIGAFEGGLLLKPGGNDASSPLRNTRINARYSQGYESPPLQQLFGVFRGTVNGPANPELGPERVNQIEVGIRQKFQYLDISVTGWMQDGRDMIAIVMGELQNTGTFEHRGVEANLKLRPSPQLLLEGGFSSYELSENVLRVPWNTLDFGLRFRPTATADRNLIVSFHGYYTSQLYDGPPRMRLDNYLVLNGKIRINVAERTHFFAEGQNLGDKEYETVMGIPMPGRSFFAGAGIYW